ncbi:MAG: helix-turn-helix domain-containing protein [Gemmatimonadota bacterium]|nr:MAG: helix-turn-helix domain-containing protein [Gemmatimonadota bacterium]
MRLADLVAEFEGMRADYARLEAMVRGDRLIDFVIAKLEQVDTHGDPLDGPDMNTAEAGRLLGLAAKTVERLCRQRKIQARKTSPNGEWRISRTALQEYRNGRSSTKTDLKLVRG